MTNITPDELAALRALLAEREYLPAAHVEDQTDHTYYPLEKNAAAILALVPTLLYAIANAEARAARGEAAIEMCEAGYAMDEASSAHMQWQTKHTRRQVDDARSRYEAAIAAYRADASSDGGTDA